MNVFTSKKEKNERNQKSYFSFTYNNFLRQILMRTENDLSSTIHNSALA